MQRFADKTAIVTGAARGNGLAIAERLLREGARVWLVDVDADEVRRVAEISPRALPAPFDVASESAVAEFYGDLDRDRERVDALVNCAAIQGGEPLAEMSLDNWHQIHAVNLTGPLLMCKHALPLLSAHASIINIGSIASLRGFSERVAYCSSKHALLGLTRALALELAPRDIRVNCVCPGTVDSPSLEAAIMKSEHPELARQAFAARQPLGRMGTGEEVASVVAFLASGESSFMTGSLVSVDGGMAARV